MHSLHRCLRNSLLAVAAVGLFSCEGVDILGFGGSKLNVPIEVADLSSTLHPRTPISMGIPFAEGELLEVPELEVALDGGENLPACGEALSFWSDGSVRWLQLEFITPAVLADQQLKGSLRERGRQTKPGGNLDLVQMLEGQNLSVDNGMIRIEPGGQTDELFLITPANDSPLAGAIRAEFESLSEDFQAEQLLAGQTEVESANELRVTLKRTDTFLSSLGREVARITTRISIWREVSELKIQQSLDVIGGTHKMDKWDLIFPLNNNANSTAILLPDNSVQEFNNNFSLRQVEHDAWRLDGADFSGRLPGVVAVDGMAIGMRHFWQLHPSGIQRQADELRLELCPGTINNIEVLEEGFGRTQDIWLHFGSPSNAPPLADFGNLLARPMHGKTTPQQYLESGASGDFALAILGSNPQLEESIANSADELLNRREAFAVHDYGIEGFGDYFSATRNPSYWGAMQQEYDPTSVMLIQFQRTGDVAYMEAALESAWHYADVDISPYGGAFQHRAARHHLETWIAKQFRAELVNQARNASEYDSTIDGLIDWAGVAYGPDFANKLERWVGHEQENGAIGAEIKDRAFLMIGMNEVLEIESQLSATGGLTMFQMAEGISQHQRSQELGFTDATSQFDDFFALFGGSWADFPSFHVDNDPIPDYRHMGSHGVIQGVTWAYLLTGEARLGIVAKKFAKHQIDHVVPTAIAHIEDVRDNSSNRIYSRNIAWPLINAISLLELTEGQAEYSQLNAELNAAATWCANTLITLDYARIRSSINAGLSMEALAEYHRLNPRQDIADYLSGLAQYWTENAYDQDLHAFHNEPDKSDTPSSAISGLCIYGLMYAQQFNSDPGLAAVTEDAWNYLAQETSYGKSFAMHYRGAPRALKLFREQQIAN